MEIRDRVLRRAARWWADTVRSRHFNAGNRTLQESMISVLAEAAAPKAAEDAIVRFEAELYTALSADTRRWISLEVDYGPDGILSDAAKKAGMDPASLPIKSSTFIDAASFSSRLGYGAQPQYWYPLSNGKWLAAYLCGNDIDKVIASVENGNPLGLSIVD